MDYKTLFYIIMKKLITPINTIKETLDVPILKKNTRCDLYPTNNYGLKIKMFIYVVWPQPAHGRLKTLIFHGYQNTIAQEIHPHTSPSINNNKDQKSQIKLMVFGPPKFWLGDFPS